MLGVVREVSDLVRVASRPACGVPRGDTDEKEVIGDLAFLETSVNLQGPSPWPPGDV